MCVCVRVDVGIFEYLLFVYLHCHRKIVVHHIDKAGKECAPEHDAGQV